MKIELVIVGLYEIIAFLSIFFWLCLYPFIQFKSFLMSAVVCLIWDLFSFLINNQLYFNLLAQSAGAVRLCRLHLRKGVRNPPYVCFRYYTKTASDGEAPVLKLWKTWTVPSLPLFPGPHETRIVVPIIISSIGQIEIFNTFLGLEPFNCVQKMTDAKLN